MQQSIRPQRKVFGIVCQRDTCRSPKFLTDCSVSAYDLKHPVNTINRSGFEQGLSCPASATTVIGLPAHGHKKQPFNLVSLVYIQSLNSDLLCGWSRKTAMENHNSECFPSRFRAYLYRDCLGFSRYVQLSNWYFTSTKLHGACFSLSWSRLLGLCVLLASLQGFSGSCCGDSHEHS